MRRDYNRNSRKNSIKKERVIMLASSAFVLTALTMTGLYMKSGGGEEKNDGYTLDFTAMEDSAEDKFQEIAQGGDGSGSQVADSGVQNQSGNTGMQNQTGNTTLGTTGGQEYVTEDDLDYMPLEAGSGQVEIPGLTNQSGYLLENAENPEGDLLTAEGVQSGAAAELAGDGTATDNQAAAAESSDKTASSQEAAGKTVSFAEDSGLLRPVSGEVLMSYSMDKSVYFATLDQYKYNPAVIFSAAQGAEVISSAAGKVTGVSENEEIGKAVTVDLGNGYQATYGQLSEIQAKEGDYVNAGEKLGIVAAPTKYYSTEGSNLYFKLTKDGAPVDPEGLFQ